MLTFILATKGRAGRKVQASRALTLQCSCVALPSLRAQDRIKWNNIDHWRVIHPNFSSRFLGSSFAAFPHWFNPACCFLGYKLLEVRCLFCSMAWTAGVLPCSNSFHFIEASSDHHGCWNFLVKIFPFELDHLEIRPGEQLSPWQSCG